MVVATDLATEYQDVTLPLAGLTLELQPQSLLALPLAAESWYRVDLRTPHRRESYLIQVPESGTPLALRDLVGAAEIPPGSLPADIVADVLEAAAEAPPALRAKALGAAGTLALRQGRFTVAGEFYARSLTEAELAGLKSMGVDFVQGYLLHRPAPLPVG